MRILITNDDGIHAPGLKALSQIAHDLAGPSGQVISVAPLSEQSGVGHCVTYNRPVPPVQAIDHNQYFVEGTPADCVLMALSQIYQEARPDLILSGVNRGNNSGENAVYSGTLGAAMEGALQNVPAIGLSQFYGPKLKQEQDMFATSRAFAGQVIQAIFDKNIWKSGAYSVFYSVNFPPCPPSEVEGIQLVPQGFRQGQDFTAQRQTTPKEAYWLSGGDQHAPALPEKSDVNANRAGYISVTPMSADLTAYPVFDQLQGIFA